MINFLNSFILRRGFVDNRLKQTDFSVFNLFGILIFFNNQDNLSRFLKKVEFQKSILKIYVISLSKNPKVSSM